VIKAAALVVAGLLTVPTVPAAPPAHPGGQDGRDPSAFILQLEQALGSGGRDNVAVLFSPKANRPAILEILDNDLLRPGITRVTLRDHDRAPIEEEPSGAGYHLLLEVFTERGPRGRITTWRADIRHDRVVGTSDANPPLLDWGLASLERLSSIDGLHRLALDPTRQYDVRGLTIRGIDLTLTVKSGTAFVAETDDGPTALVVRGRGEMVFAPAPEAERGQVKLFCGSDSLRTRFDGVYVRLNPGDFDDAISQRALTPRPPDDGELRRARAIFDEHVGEAYALNLSDLSREVWSLTPRVGDLLAEVHTDRHGVLTYARSGNEAEDVTLFDRRRRRNISVYMSPQKLATIGPFYNEDDLSELDILHHDLDVAFSPDRDWVQGRSTLTVRVRGRSTSTMTLRLAEPLKVHSIVSKEFGRLLFLRVIGQNNVLVNLPSVVVHDTTFSVTVRYSGRLTPQQLEREAIAPQQTRPDDAPLIPPEPRFIYSSRSHWYPQSSVSDYATSRIRVTVPADIDCVATGQLARTPTLVPGTVPPGEETRKEFLFEADRPVRYLAVVISRFTRVQSAQVQLPPGETRATLPGGPDDSEAGAARTLDLVVHANPRQQGRARRMSDRSAAILQYYSSLIGEAPYPSFTLAVTESTLPGGHSPAYFAVMSEPLPASNLTWRADPVAFEGYPDFFLAHEIAHQWWGQAVGWKNYHEQWLSEGIAQYFTALFARHDRGQNLFDDVMRQMRRWALSTSDQGPVYLGYRLGHVSEEGRVFRALVYNKSAVVLHMLRRLIGDEAFFAGMRRFYQELRFDKAGTDDLRRAMEAEAGRSLQRFFDRWILGSSLPQLAFSHRETDGAVVLRFEQGNEIFDLPVTVRLHLRDGSSRDIVVPVTEKITEMRVPIESPLRRIDVNEDHAALVEIKR
jgi:hypothetical protein